MGVILEKNERGLKEENRTLSKVGGGEKEFFYLFARTLKKKFFVTLLLEGFFTDLITKRVYTRTGFIKGKPNRK